MTKPKRKTSPAPRGRPSKYTDALAAEICERMADGELLTDICREDHMPTRKTVWQWTQVNPTFRDVFAHAREELAHTLVEGSISIADDSSQDYVETENGRVVDAEHIQRSKLRVDTRKWFASKMVARIFGDKVAHEMRLSGDVALHAKSDAELQAEIARLAARLGASTVATANATVAEDEE